MKGTIIRNKNATDGFLPGASTVWSDTHGRQQKCVGGRRHHGAASLIPLFNLLPEGYDLRYDTYYECNGLENHVSSLTKQLGRNEAEARRR